MSVESIELRNYMIFSNLKINFLNGINVLIGENGTGKTQLLRAMYGDVQISKGKNINDMSSISNKSASSDDGGSYKVSYSTKEFKYTFIPSKDMLTHSKGFLQIADNFIEFPFDKTLIDIIKIAQQWQLNKPPKIALKILPILERMMQGKVVIENEEFYVRKDSGEMVNFAIEAEGLKKIGLLWQLLMNENITEGSVLLWDAPENNINPKYISDLVEILLELQRNGVQVFVTTHDYIFAKYLEVKRSKEDEIMYYSLYKTDEGVKCESNLNFRNLKNNTIMDTFIQLYKDEVESAML